MEATTDLLRELAQHGLTQTEIAKRTGIPQPRLSRWAGGAVPTGADDALKLQALLTTARGQGAQVPKDAGDTNAPVEQPTERQEC